PLRPGVPVLPARARPGARRVLRCPLAAGDGGMVFGAAPVPVVAAGSARDLDHPGRDLDRSLPRPRRPDGGAAAPCRMGVALVRRRLFCRHGASLRVDHGLVSGATLARHGDDPYRVPLGPGDVPLHAGPLPRARRRGFAVALRRSAAFSGSHGHAAPPDSPRRAAPAVTEPDVTLTDVGLALECGLFAVLITRQCSRVALSFWFVAFFASVGAAALAGAAVHGGFAPEPTSIVW